MTDWKKIITDPNVLSLLVSIAKSAVGHRDPVATAHVHSFLEEAQKPDEKPIAVDVPVKEAPKK